MELENKNLLYGKIKEKGYLIDFFCKKIGISKGTWYLKIKSNTFTAREMSKIADELELDEQTICKIFITK